MPKRPRASKPGSQRSSERFDPAQQVVRVCTRKRRSLHDGQRRLDDHLARVDEGLCHGNAARAQNLHDFEDLPRAFRLACALALTSQAVSVRASQYS